MTWTYTLCTGMDTAWNIRYSKKKYKHVETLIYKHIVYKLTAGPTNDHSYNNAFSLQLGGGPHQVDVFELFPATFQVKPSKTDMFKHLICFFLLHCE